MNCRTTVTWSLLSIAIVVCGVSCSSPPALSPASGKVTWKGQPLEGARVIFHPTAEGQTEWPAGLTGSDGTFTVKTGEYDGAAVGSYKVSIVAPEVSTSKPKGMAMNEEVDRLKGAYSNPASSKLSAEIKEGPNELPPFDLK